MSLQSFVYRQMFLRLASMAAAIPNTREAVREFPSARRFRNSWFLNKAVLALLATLIAVNTSHAHQPAQASTNPLDAIPVAMPFCIPYGSPITLERAQIAAHAAMAEAVRSG